MTDEMNAAMEWTEAKLRHARLHLAELRQHAGKGSGDDFERAHIDAFLHQLIGAQDAFLQEVNLYYRCALSTDQVKLWGLRQCLEGRGERSEELDTLALLLNTPATWLSDATEMRRQCTHRRDVPRTFFVGGETDREAHPRDAKTGVSVGQEYAILFETWIDEMTDLLAKLRTSARSANRITS